MLFYYNIKFFVLQALKHQFVYYQKQYPENIIVLSQENSGQATARNNGLKFIKGKYINFLDSDDYLSEETLENVLDFFNKHESEIDVLAIPIKFFGRNENYHILNEKFKYLNDNDKEFKWLTDFNVGKGLQESNEKRLEILEYYGKINDVSLQECFIEFVKENPNAADNLELVSDLLTRLSYSNSGEIFTFRKEIAKQLLEVENPIESLGRIEKIFIKNFIYKRWNSV